MKEIQPWSKVDLWNIYSAATFWSRFFFLNVWKQSKTWLMTCPEMEKKSKLAHICHMSLGGNWSRPIQILWNNSAATKCLPPRLAPKQAKAGRANTDTLLWVSLKVTKVTWTMVTSFLQHTYILESIKWRSIKVHFLAASVHVLHRDYIKMDDMRATQRFSVTLPVFKM